MIITTSSLNFLGLSEPVTTLTDYLITVFCLFFYFKLNKDQSETIKNWRLFFLLFGISTFLGGSVHGFFSVREGLGFNIVWLTSQVISIVSTWYAQRATLSSILVNSSNKHYWRISYNLQLIVFIISVFIFHSFMVVIVNTAVGLIPVMMLHFKNSKTDKTNAWVGYGIAVSFLTALVNATKVAIDPVYFNHKDIAHLFIILTLSIMYVGIKRKSIS